ncbi:MAG: NAD(P) transhydrogenase subunit alpha [Bacillota bacterium]|nr:NAD(P) transhydrogenase subunit alpha [Bacillota bacterium]
MQFTGITIGIPREIMPGERRVAAVPETISKMIAAGADVLVETGAGNGAYIDDDSYRDKGAEIISDPIELYKRANLVIKVKEPRYHEKLGKHEAELLQQDSILIGFLHPAHSVNHAGLKILAERNITSFTLDGIPRISKAQQMDALTSMSTVAGYKAVIFAAGHLGRFIPMMPTSFGIIQPAQFLVIGTGVAGLQSIATAKRLGAKVKTLDIRPDANEQARSLGAENIEFNIPKEVAVGTGGYARRLDEEWYARERDAIAPHIAQSDAVILTALIPGEVAPRLIDEQMVSTMKKGSVIVDIAVDQGGNCTLTRCGEDYEYNGIIISGIMNIPATLPVDATNMFAQNAWHFISYLVQEGKVNTDIDDDIVHPTLVTTGKRIVHHGALMAMGIE